jgi:hypothetical protein
MGSATPPSSDSDDKSPLRARIAEAREASKAAKQADYDFNVAAAQLIGDLRYPVSKDGTVVDLSYFSPLIAYHLARCGWRCDPAKRRIKSRKIAAKGVVSDALEWVDVNAPDDPLANLKSMTMAEINRLPPVQRAEAIRRIGGPELPDLPANPGWHVATNMTIEHAPDPDDGKQWTRRKTGGKQ